MDRQQELMTFMHELASDIRLKPTHISLCFALCHAWVKSNFQNFFQISRRKLMAASRIQSRATYHKVMKDLQAFGYLKYTPSYHPLKGSSVGLVIRDFTTNQGVNKVSNDLAHGQAHYLDARSMKFLSRSGHQLGKVIQFLSKVRLGLVITLARSKNQFSACESI